MARLTSSLALLAHPYSRLQPLEPTTAELRARGRQPGSALVWSMGTGDRSVGRVILGRPGGLSLLVILPPEAELMSSPGLSLELHQLRAHGILPFHSSPSASDLAQVLRRPPIDLAADVTDYLRWRGLSVDRDTVHLLRRVLDLSADLRCISSVSRSMYMSRRALGRRLTTRGLPVPSHWLQMGRLLRVAVRLQNTDATVSSVAFEHGYPDGFALSNQMERFTGYRPVEVRRRLGWEWLVESWLRQEAERGGLTTPIARPAEGDEHPQAISMSRPSRATRTSARHGAGA